MCQGFAGGGHSHAGLGLESVMSNPMFFGGWWIFHSQETAKTFILFGEQSGGKSRHWFIIPIDARLVFPVFRMAGIEGSMDGASHIVFNNGFH